MGRDACDPPRGWVGLPLSLDQFNCRFDQIIIKVVLLIFPIAYEFSQALIAIVAKASSLSIFPILWNGSLQGGQDISTTITSAESNMGAFKKFLRFSD